MYKIEHSFIYAPYLKYGYHCIYFQETQNL